MKLIARLLDGGRLNIETTGNENIPPHGPVILAARHFHHLYDGVALFEVVPREIHILVTLDWAESRMTRWFMEAAIRFAGWPVVLRRDALTRRSDGMGSQSRSVFSENDIARYQRRALRDGVEVLARGGALLIFPEGYPNIDPNFTPKKTSEKFLPFHAGFAVIAAATERRLGATVPTIPVGLHYEAGERWRVRICYGAPMTARDFASRRSFVEAVEATVIKLSKQ
jgi:putative membrane protein